MFEKAPSIKNVELSAEEIAEKEFDALGEVKTSEEMEKELDETIQKLKNPEAEEVDSQEAIN